MATTPSSACRAIRSSLQGTRWATSHQFARTITTESHTLNPSGVPEELLPSHAHPRPAHQIPTTPRRPLARSSDRKGRWGPPPAPIPTAPGRKAPLKPEFQYKDTDIDASIKQLLPMLKSQKPHYIQIHIHEKPYLITQGDTIRLPFLMPDVNVGDVLRLNRATLLGSRDYTLKAGAPKDGRKRGWLDERLFECRARVVGVELEPLRIKEVTKRRRRHVKHIKSKHSYTVLRVMEVKVNGVEQVDGNAAPAGMEKSVDGWGISDSEIQHQVIEEDRPGNIEELVKETEKINI